MEENSEWNAGFNQDFIVLFKKIIIIKDCCLAVNFGEDLICVNRSCLMSFRFHVSMYHHLHRKSCTALAQRIQGVTIRGNLKKKPADVAPGDMV